MYNLLSHVHTTRVELLEKICKKRCALLFIFLTPGENSVKIGELLHLTGPLMALFLRQNSFSDLTCHLAAELVPYVCFAPTAYVSDIPNVSSLIFLGFERCLYWVCLSTIAVTIFPFPTFSYLPYSNYLPFPVCASSNYVPSHGWRSHCCFLIYVLCANFDEFYLESHAHFKYS